jgi:MFS family permease
VSTANVVGVLWAAAMFAWFFISALYLQLVLGYSPMQVGLAFLPANLIMAAFSLGLSAKIVMRFGIRGPLAVGLGLAAVGLLLFAQAPVGGQFALHVLPGMLLLGLGAGIAFNPLLLAAMSDVSPADSGLASGVVNTAFMMGGALGLAVLASLAAARTTALVAAGTVPAAALNIERSTRIKAPPEKVHALINNFDAWAQWSPWEKKDPAMKRTRSGPAGGKGAVYGWEGNKAVGQGRMEITESTVRPAAC